MEAYEIAALIIGVLGAIFIAIFSIPGLVRIVKTKDTASVSMLMFILLAIGVFLFVVNAIITMSGKRTAADLGICIGNLSSMSCALAAVILKAKAQRQAKKHNMTEKQWNEKMFKAAQDKKAAKKLTQAEVGA